MIVEHEGTRPRIHPSAFVAPNAVVCGDVTIGEDARVLFGAVLTAEGGAIEIGASTIVMENAVIRGRAGNATTVGRHVLIGPHSHVNGASIEDEVFVATGAALFPGARIGAGSEVRINAVVHVNTHVEPRTTVPIGWIAVGNPAQLFSPDQHEELWRVQRESDFPGTLFGLAREEATMERITAQYVERFGKHRADRRVG
ncbi:gamma carbonic anhydrase family protein [Amycolatopsis minnesotensis]|uniref:gamma carbonic anhydrase family protein n=1 Tax=Amycolatopsis minnesotensis TaxID=337894 RepID=UPI0031D37328